MTEEAFRVAAESIAFYKGESREASQANSRLLRLVVTIVRKIQWQAGLDLWKHVYVYATMLLPALWMAPKYFAGTIEFGVISQVLDYSQLPRLPGLGQPCVF